MTPEAVAEESPLFTIWEAPRSTIRRIVDTDPRRGVNGLFFVAGAVAGLHVLAGRLDMLGLPLVAVPIACIVFGILYVPIGHLNALYRRWLGSWLGGTATRIEVAAASAWASVPVVVGHGTIWLVRLALYGSEALAAEHPTIDAASPLLRTTLDLGEVLFTLWSIAISLVGFAEVNRFSITRAIATAVLATLIAATIAGIAIATLVLF
jgi:hypothetical protein